MLDGLRAIGFEIETHSHAKAILEADFPETLAEIEAVLSGLRIPIAEFVRGGGGETPATQRLRHAFADSGWRKTRFEVRKTISDVVMEAIGHEVDHVRTLHGRNFALEIEWNNKDPFFDRDLENFKRLHADGAVSVGVILTRGANLHDALRGMLRAFADTHGIDSYAGLQPFASAPTPRQRNAVERLVARGAPFAEAWSGRFYSEKLGEATTHWRGLSDRVRRGVGTPCPLLPSGIPPSAIIR